MTEQLAPAGVTHAGGRPGLPAGVPVAADGTPAREADRRATVVAVLENPAAATGTALARLPDGVTGIEVRADLVGDLDPGQLRRYASGQLVYALRSRRHGGSGPDAVPDRQARLVAAARDYDLVDLEYDHDLVPGVLAGVPPDRRRISWRGGDVGLAELRRRFEQMARVPAALYLLAPQGRSFPAAIDALRLLGSLRRTDVTAFGTAPTAAFTRVLAPWLGAPVVYGRATGPTVQQILTDYPFPALAPLSSLCGIVGRSVQTSLFVQLVNAALGGLSIPRLCLPFAVPEPADFPEFLPTIEAGHFDALGLPLRALTVAVPYKPAAFAAAASADPRAQAAQAANFLLRTEATGGQWRAVTTDGSAMLAALTGTRSMVPVAGTSIAVIGCGAAGRAAAVALAGAGAKVTMVNRGPSRGQLVASRLGLPFVPLDAFQPGRYAVLVHATPVADRLPFDLDDVAPDTVVADFICAAEPTALVAAARRRGLATVDGRDVLVHEVRQQFQLMTGQPMPAGPVMDVGG
jgi:3-dehydroquinate dehydratase/shikimate dehydrogenase